MSASSKKKLRKEQQTLQLTEKQKQAKKEAKKLKIYTIAFVLVMVIAFGAFVVSVVGKAVNSHLESTGYWARHNTVLEVNDHDIKAVELNYFYIDAISNQYNAWYNEYGTQTSLMLMYMYGLNISQPLNASYYDSQNKVTWADMFGNQAIQDAIEIYTLYDAAKAAGHQMTEEEKQNVEEILHNIEHTAIDNNFENLQAYLKYMYGNGARVNSYRAYLNVVALANSYRNAYSDNLNYTEADYKAYLEKHPNDFATFSYTSYQLNVSDFYQGGTKDEATGSITYSDTEKAAAEAACKAAADAIQAAKPANAKELNAAIANLDIYKNAKPAEGETTVEIPESSASTDVSFAYLNSSYKDWLGDASRKTGDFTIVPITSTTQNEDGTETTVTTGYYAVIFESRNDYAVDTVTVRHILADFRNGTTVDGVTTYSEAEKNAAKQRADEVMALFNATGKTEDDFAGLVEAYTADGGSKYNGGLYSHVMQGQMVKAFDAWIFDANRKTGDCEIVETEYGYHLIYFVEKDALNYRDYMLDTNMRAEATSEWLAEMVKNTKVGEKDISQLDLDFVIAPSGY